MIRPPPIPTRTDPLFPSPTLFRSPAGRGAQHAHPPGGLPCPRGHAVRALFGARRFLARALSIGRSRRHLHAAIEQQSGADRPRSEEHTSELQSLMRLSYAVFCLKKKNNLHT